MFSGLRFGLRTPPGAEGDDGAVTGWNWTAGGIKPKDQKPKNEYLAAYEIRTWALSLNSWVACRPTPQARAPLVCFYFSL